MKNFLSFRPRNTVLLLLLLWLVVSAFYYAEYLFSPSFHLGYDEGILHKVLKYVVCLGLSLYFCVTARAYRLLLFCALMMLLASYFAIDRGVLEITTLSIMIIATMMPFIFVSVLWEGKLLLVGRVIVICGAAVGVFSIIELTLLKDLFEAYWISTSSIRSISTMFNPNNLGLYTGISLLLLPYMKFRTDWMVVFGALLIFSLAASGSRTAWVSLVIALIYALIIDANIRHRLTTLLTRNLPKLVLSVITMACVYATYLAFSTPSEFEVAHRGADLYTANIRWQNFLTFFSMIDGSIFFPDQLGKRSDYIQDNFYLVVLNSFGILGLFLLLIFFVTHFSRRRSNNPDLIPWKLVFIFYMVSGLSGSQLNSFPNNQLFFLSMGALWIYRPEFKVTRTARTGENISVTSLRKSPNKTTTIY